MKPNITHKLGRTLLPLTKGLVFAGLLSGPAALAQAPVTFSGSVFNDADGIKDNMIDGPIISTVSNFFNTTTSQLYVYLFNNQGFIIDKATVVNGAYSLTGVSNVQYGIRLSTINTPIGLDAPSATLPANWVYTAEGTPPTGDGFADGLVSVAPNNPGSITNINFGIDRRPLSQNYVLSATNFNSAGRIIIPANAFNGSDPEDGLYNTGFIGRTVHLYAASNGTLYYDYGNGPTPVLFVVANSFTAIENFNPANLSLAPAGSGPIYFSFSAVDNAGVPEAVPNQISTPIALRIDLKELAAQWKGESAQLSWTTASEEGTKLFYVERSTDGRNFSRIATIDSKADRGFSKSELNYSFMDEGAASQNGNIYYRIQELDISGRTAASNTVVLRSNGTTSSSALTAGPIPANSRLNVYMNSQSAEAVTLSLYDMRGSMVRSTKLSGVEGSSTTSLDVADLPAGMYMLKTSTESGNEQILRVSVAH